MPTNKHVFAALFVLVLGNRSDPGLRRLMSFPCFSQHRNSPPRRRASTATPCHMDALLVGRKQIAQHVLQSTATAWTTTCAASPPVTSAVLHAFDRVSVSPFSLNFGRGYYNSGGGVCALCSSSCGDCVGTATNCLNCNGVPGYTWLQIDT